MKKIVALVAIVALLLGVVGTAIAVLTADDASVGGASSSRLEPVPVEAEGDPAPETELERFYTQELDWEECRSGKECATVEVPLDYAEPEGETIEISVLRVAAEGTALGSMVVNPGGPGAPGTDYAEMTSMVFGRALRQNFDVVGFDPRGTGASAPVDCLSDAELDEYVAGNPMPDTPESIAEFEAASKTFGDGCKRRSGDLVNHVSTVETAKDMDVIRAALGDAALTYFGASYGTKLGATYAELFPERVGRLVLDGGVDVGLDSTGMSLEQARGFETALRAYVADCVDKIDDCFLGDSVDEGTAAIADLLEQIEREPMPAGDRELHAGEAFYGVVMPLYVADYWFMLTNALRAAMEDGDGSALADLADMYLSRTVNGDGSSTYANNSTEAILAINCLDDPTSVSAQDVPSYFDEFTEASPTFGKAFAWGLIGCSGMPGRTAEPAPVIDGEGAAPILVVGTTRDPATPFEWSEALADQLDSGVLLVRDGDGHTGYNSGNACVNEAVEGYLVSGIVPDDRTQC